MSPEISERAFERAIECALLRHGPDACAGEPSAVREATAAYGETPPGGYRRRQPEEYDRVLCLLPRDVVDFVLATQLLPWCRERRIPIMAYSPIEQSPRKQKGMLGNPQLEVVAQRRGATPAQVALAWLLRQDGMIVIPKATNPAHVRENRRALDLVLTDEDVVQLDRAFPPPRKKMVLDTG